MKWLQAHPKALDGCEVSNVAKGALATYTSAVVDTITKEVNTKDREVETITKDVSTNAKGFGKICPRDGELNCSLVDALDQEGMTDAEKEARGGIIMEINIIHGIRLKFQHYSVSKCTKMQRVCPINI